MGALQRGHGIQSPIDPLDPGFHRDIIPVIHMHYPQLYLVPQLELGPAPESESLEGFALSMI